MNAFYEKPSKQGEEIVVITRVLPSEVNNGYDDFIDERIVEVNGIKILNLRDFIQIVENGTDDPYVVFKTKRGNVIALDQEEVKQAQDEILKIYHISSDRSLDLKPL